MQMKDYTAENWTKWKGNDMSSFQEYKEALLAETEKLHERYELSKTMTPDFFEPGMMEYPEQSEGIWDEDSGELLLRFESKGTRYDGRTELIEGIKVGEEIQIIRDPDNEFNSNNFRLFTKDGKDVGNMPAVLCNVIAPLFDEDGFVVEYAEVSFVDPISKRSRHAKQAVLFVEMRGRLAADEWEQRHQDEELYRKRAARDEYERKEDEHKKMILNSIVNSANRTDENKRKGGESETSPVRPVKFKSLQEELKYSGFKIVDNSISSLILWVFYDRDMADKFYSIVKKYSVKYALEKRGAMATNGAPAWRIMFNR